MKFKDRFEELNILRTCALLHDVGKVQCWVEGEPLSRHIHYTYEIVKDCLGEELANIAMRHHTGTTYPSECHPQTDHERIISLANDMGSSEDISSRTDASDVTGFPLVLTHVISNGAKARKTTDVKELIHIARTVRDKLESAGKDFTSNPAIGYAKIYNSLRESGLRLIPTDPQAPTNDVSLWDHLKLTAALTTCIYLDTGYKGLNLEEYSFLLLSGDADKITRFINVSRMLPDLRAGSQIVEKATQLATKAIEHELGPECVVFSGGGGFLALAPRIGAQIIDKAKESFETATDNELTITVNSVPSTGLDIRNSFGELWKKAIYKIRMKKLASPPKASFAVELGESVCDVCHLRLGEYPTAKLLGATA